MRNTSAFIAVALAFACATTPALAQPKKPKPVAEELTGDARTKWDDAKRLFDVARNYDAALVQYQQAYELSKNPRVLFSVGICQRNLNRYAAAVATFKKELAEGGDKLPKDEIADLNRFISGLEPFVSSAEIVVNEPGAKVVVNSPGPGAPIELGTSPLSGPVPVEIGTRTFTITKDKFDDAIVTVPVKKGEVAKLDVKLLPKIRKSLVTIDVEGGSGATVFIDDLDMGPGPFKGEVTVGRHRFTVKSPGFKPAEKTEEVEEGKPLPLKFSLAPDRKEAGLVINVTPVSGIIELDGRPLGNTRHWEGPVKSGRHIIEVRRDGYVTSKHEIFAADDETRDVNAKLDREKDTSWVPWTLGTLAVVAGATVAAFVVFRANDQSPVIGTLDPGTTPGTFRFR